MTRFVTAVVLAVAVVPAVARANVEIGGTVGLHIFSDNNGIGVKDVPDADSQKNSALFALRLGVYFNPKLGVELEAGGIPGEARSILFDVVNVVVRGSVVYQLWADQPTKRVVPFGILGAGLHSIVKSDNTDDIAKDNKAVPFLGIGTKYRADNGWGVRAEARLLLPPSSASGSVTADFEALVSVYREYGRAEMPRKKEQPRPKTEDNDPDHDGIVGAADKCPTEAEDKDGFQDEDGCPDPDNDNDGVLDAADKCPTEAEDKDGFQDEDGCPDPDNDNDGVLDAADKCPIEAETKNGFADDDGCPDEVPDKLKQAIGVLAAVNFKGADLVPGTTKQLDTAAAVLGEYKDVRLEIAAHTDDVALPAGGKFADNQALSQARADAVKAYLVGKGVEEARLVAKGYGDTQPVVDPKPLKGPQQNAARAKNRRVELKLIVDGAAPAAAPTATP